jgi:cellulose biosynthesis protein BcsQ
MTAYAFWNNKGGVGKSYLCFVAAAEYANNYKDSDVYVIDLCPQANVSETLLGGAPNSPKAMNSLLNNNPRATVAGYLEERLSSPFKMIPDVSTYVTHPRKHNSAMPENLYLVCGDNLLEVIAEAIRQTSQLSIPVNAWKQVISWIKDLVSALTERSGDRDSLVILDCNPSFAIYTQLALAAADYVVVPFTADDSSRRGIENVVALLFGQADSHTAAYAKLSFFKQATTEGLKIPKLHTFVCNRVTMYEGKASTAFEAISKTIKTTLDKIHSKHRSIFANPKNLPSKGFVQIPDYHTACIVSASNGIPIHKIKPGPQKMVGGEKPQINKDRLDNYKKSLAVFVDCL